MTELDLPEDGIMTQYQYSAPGDYTVKVTVENLDINEAPKVQQRNICIKKKVG